jgi:hypothetical protein
MQSSIDLLNYITLEIFQPVIMLAGGGALALWILLSLYMTIRDRLQGDSG